MRRHKHRDEFVAHDSNTTCDISGFKTKRSKVVRRWEGFMVLPEFWHPRHPQDFPVTAIPQKTVPDVRTANLTVKTDVWDALVWKNLVWAQDVWAEDSGVQSFNKF